LSRAREKSGGLDEMGKEYSLKVNTGEQAEVYRRIEEAFLEIANKLEPKPLKRPSQIEMKVNHVYDNRTKTFSDDIVHRLFYQQKVVAIVSESRDEANMIVFDFFDNSDKILNEMAEKEIPRFIELRGCVNCPTSKLHKERHGTEYGFDHELILSCLIGNCMENGHALYEPFIDPEEIMKFAEISGNKKYVENAKRYLRIVKEKFGDYYEMLGVNLGD